MMKNLITATWTMSIDEQVLVKEMLETGEYGIGGHPISEVSMIEFFRNWAFGLDPTTYQKEWARNPRCHYQMSLFDNASEKELWQVAYPPVAQEDK